MNDRSHEQIDTTTFAFHDRDNDGQVTYYPWTDGWAVGFRAVHDDGRVEYIYLNPSGGSDDGVPNVFLYQGTEGDVRQDPAYHHYDLFGIDYPQAGKPSATALQHRDHTTRHFGVSSSPGRGTTRHFGISFSRRH